MVRNMTVASRLHAALTGAGPVVTRDVDVRRDVAVRAPDGTGPTDIYLARPTSFGPATWRLAANP